MRRATRLLLILHVTVSLAMAPFARYKQPPFELAAITAQDGMCVSADYLYFAVQYVFAPVKLYPPDHPDCEEYIP